MENRPRGPIDAKRSTHLNFYPASRPSNARNLVAQSPYQQAHTHHTHRHARLPCSGLFVRVLRRNRSRPIEGKAVNKRRFFRQCYFHSYTHLLNPAPTLPIRLRVPRPRVHTAPTGTSAADFFGFQNAVRANVERLQDSATAAGFVAVNTPDAVCRPQYFRCFTHAVPQ